MTIPFGLNKIFNIENVILCKTFTNDNYTFILLIKLPWKYIYSKLNYNYY